MIQQKRGQEEMIGFGLIVVMVMVILLIILGISIGRDDRDVTQHFELESFLQSSLEITTTCENNFEPLSLREVIFLCDQEDSCFDNIPACESLQNVIKGILETSFPVGDERPIKGYEFNITSQGMHLFYEEDGNKTRQTKASKQTFVRRSRQFEIIFVTYN